MANKRGVVNLDIPVDLLMDILSRLPVKILLRFKSVCKVWYDLIENPDFIEIYGKINPPTKSILLTSHRYLYFDSDGIYNPIDFDSLYFSVVGICNGLVCVRYSIQQHGFIIGNPTTREFRRIPLPNLPVKEKDLFFYGFNSFANEFKLLRVIYRTSLAGEVVVMAEVYVMNTNIWVEIDVKLGRVVNVEHLDYYCRYNMIPVILKGVFYWAPWTRNDARVVFFDIFSGFYDEINVPLSFATLAHRDEDDYCMRIIAFDEKLSYISSRDNHRFELWELSENKSSWTWKLSIDTFTDFSGRLTNYKGVFFVVGYAKNGEVLIENRYNKNSKLILYDLKSGEIKRLPRVDDLAAKLTQNYVRGATRTQNYVSGEYNFYFYTDSLCSVKSKNEVAEVA